MEGKKISQLIPDTSPSTDDFIVTVDGTTMQNKRVDLGNLPVSNPTNALFDSKVDKAPGKQLSDQNYTQGEKNKLAGIEAGAEVNEVTQADLVHNHDTRYANQALGVMAKTKFASIPSSYGYLGQKFTNGVAENDLVIYGESTQAGTPTPDVPVPIESTTGNVTVKSVDGTGNLFDKTDSIITGKLFGLDGTISDLEGVYIQATYIPVAPSTQYTMSYPSSGAMRPVQYDANKNFIVRSNATAQAHTFTTASNAAFVRISGVNHFIDDTQFERGTGTPYKAFVGSTQTLPLGTTQLRSLPNGVSDRIYKSGSSWYLEQNVERQTITGGATGAAALTTGTQFILTVTPLAYLGDDFIIQTSSDRFIGIKRVDRDTVTNSIYSFPGQNTLRINTTIASDTATFNAWLATNQPVIQYILATPITTEITDQTLITALENIRTYQGITSITASTPVSGSYGLDMTATLNGKVSKAGDTMTGGLTLPSAVIGDEARGIHTNTTSGLLRLSGGTPSNGGSILLGGSTNGSVANRGILRIGFDANMEWSAARTEFLNRPVRINGVDYLTGSGFPNGVVSAPVGSTYIDTNATNGAIEWTKALGTGNTGWVVSVGDTGRRNVTSLATGVTSGSIYYRRTQNQVTMVLVDVVHGTSTGTVTYLNHPAGFAPDTGYSSTGMAWRTDARSLSANGTSLNVYALGSGEPITGSFTWITAQEYPSTLPGTA